MEYRKVKSVAKRVVTKGDFLSQKILNTMKTISDIVGGTLGPGGQPVLIERQELNICPVISKDGVSVFKSIGFLDPVSHCIMESARDAAVKTGNDAGDGTTTATILAESIVRNLNNYLKINTKVSPQKITRKIEEIFDNIIEPTLNEVSIKMPNSMEEAKPFMRAIARISANGDEKLADAVVNCFELCGDEGNVTIIESSGPSHYEVERIEGFPIPIGYEESCAKFFPAFINDPAKQRVFLSKPVFVLYHGRISETQLIVKLMMDISDAWQNKDFTSNVILVSCGFSESVLADLAGNFPLPNTINVFPLVAPMNAILNSQMHFLQDLSAFTGAKIFDPLSNPISKATVEDLGSTMESFEVLRFRSTLVGNPDEIEIFDRISGLKEQLKTAESKYEVSILNERIAKLTGGIARLKVVGSSNGELREKKDRAEDAVCAIRGSIKSGFLPGGGWGLLKVCDKLSESEYYDDDVVTKILIPSLKEPIVRLLSNVGLSSERQNGPTDPGPPLENSELDSIIYAIEDNFEDNKTIVYDAQERKLVDALDPKNMILDSLPAVLEAVRNAISIASLLGTLGGVVVFERDDVLERTESSDTNRFLRDAGAENPANERI
ncbi:MAG: hypothetical protein KGO96_07505 [Elusimicrobia bacterium]|nr:hypothetical protein [Elusimicrobiota bacterium]